MKSNITKNLEKCLYYHTKKIGTFQCFEVTIGKFGKERVDFLTFDTDNIFRCFEVKSSVEDFESPSKHTFIGHYNYYVMPYSVFQKVEHKIPKDIGVFVFDRDEELLKKPNLRKIKLSSVKKAQKKNLDKETQKTLTWSLMRSLSRETDKLYQRELGGF